VKGEDSSDNGLPLAAKTVLPVVNCDENIAPEEGPSPSPDVSKSRRKSSQVRKIVRQNVPSQVQTSETQPTLKESSQNPECHETTSKENLEQTKCHERTSKESLEQPKCHEIISKGSSPYPEGHEITSKGSSPYPEGHERHLKNTATCRVSTSPRNESIGITATTNVAASETTV
jgi:hypothetical protein